MFQGEVSDNEGKVKKKFKKNLGFFFLLAAELFIFLFNEVYLNYLKCI